MLLNDNPAISSR